MVAGDLAPGTSILIRPTWHRSHPRQHLVTNLMDSLARTILPLPNMTDALRHKRPTPTTAATRPPHITPHTRRCTQLKAQ